MSKRREYLGVTLFEHTVAFTMIVQGRRAFLQYRIRDVARSGRDVWTARKGSTPTYGGVQRAYKDESITVDVRFSRSLKAQLRELIEKAA